MGRYGRFPGTDHAFQQYVAGDTVPEVLRADKTGRIHRDYAYTRFNLRLFANRVDVLADEAADAGGIHEDRARSDRLGCLPDSGEQFLTGPVYDVDLPHVRGESPGMEAALP